jgi:hypothetical protein
VTAHKLFVGKGWNRRPTKLGLATRAKFDEMVIVALRELGATETGRFYKWQIMTKHGLLEINPNGTWIACRFDDTEAGKKFSGHWKWNHHYDEGAGEREVAFFRRQLEAIL